MKKLFNRFGKYTALSFMTLLLCALGGCSGCGEEAVAATMHLVKTLGAVAVEDAKAKSVSIIENLGLYDGYSVATEAESFAWINLDNVKLTKMDETSDVRVCKDGKNLEIVVNSGKLYFHVTEPLGDDETMHIRTSNMLIGIRGTEGWTEVLSSNHMKVALLEGKVECAVVDEDGNVLASTTIEAGETADMVCAGQDSVITTEKISEIPAFVMEEIGEDVKAALAAPAEEEPESEPVQEETEPEETGQKKASDIVAWEDAGKEDHVMDWQDENLAKAMRQITRIRDRDIMLSDVWKYKQLELNNKKISNIAALGELTNVREVYLMSNQISDISALANLKNLEKINLSENQISDISALAELTNLKTLHLTSNQVRDISFLADMTQMTKLSLNQNEISDISSLENMKLMKELDISGNRISDISALADMEDMTLLFAAHNQISDVSALANMTHMSRLWLDSNQISDISALAGMVSMTDLDLGNNQISDISALSNMTLVSQLFLNSNRIRDISPTANMTSMRKMDFSSNQISDISSLGNLTNLTILCMGSNQISDISVLRNFTKLTSLEMHGLPIKDSSPLDDLKYLTNISK